MASDALKGHLSIAGAYLIFGLNVVLCKDIANSQAVAPIVLFTLRALGAAFGGGMGGMEGTCGALCGAEMALGLTRYQGRALSGAARALHQAFERACGASICRQLKGVDSGAPLCACDDCVRRAAQALEQTRWTLPAT